MDGTTGVRDLGWTATTIRVPHGARCAAVLLAALLSSGCTSYRAVSAFGDETTAMTTVVKDEFDQIEALCVAQAEMAIVVSNLRNDGPLDQCRRSGRARSRFAALTVEVLDGYADGLGALADDAPFDLSSEMKAVGGKVRALQNRGGDAAIGTRESDALIGVAELLANALATSKRNDAIRQMVAATPDLLIVGDALRAFFVPPPDAPANAPKAPYTNLVAVISSSARLTQPILESAPMRKAEPIRTAELLRGLRARQKLLARRGPGAVVPTRVVAVIDAWISALRQFSVDALRPDSGTLNDRLAALRSATRRARDVGADVGADAER